MRLSISVIKKLSSIKVLKEASSAGISPDLKVISILNGDCLTLIPVAHQCPEPRQVNNIKGYAWQEDCCGVGRYRIIVLTKANLLSLYEFIITECEDGICRCAVTNVFEWNIQELSETLQNLQIAIKKATSLRVLTFCSREVIIIVDNNLIITLNIILEKSPVVASSLYISEEQLNTIVDAQLCGDFVAFLSNTASTLSIYSLVNGTKFYEWDISSIVKEDDAVKFVVSPDLYSVVICIGTQNIYWLKCPWGRFQTRTPKTEAVGHQRKGTVTAFVKQFPSLMKVSESARGLSSKLQSGKWCHLPLPDEMANMTVQDMFLLEDKLWCFCFDDSYACVAVISVDSGTATVSKWLKRPVVIIKGSSELGSHPFFLLHEDSICVLLVDLGPEKLINELMTYARSGAAETLSVLNDWQSIQVDLGVLHQGLRNRQLDTVEFFLRMHAEAFHQMWTGRNSTDDDDWLTQLKAESVNWDQILFLLLNTVQVSMNDSSSWQFANQLIQMTLSTLLNILCIVVENAIDCEGKEQTKVQNLESVNSFTMQLTKYLHEARQFLHENHTKRKEIHRFPIGSEEIDIYTPAIQNQFTLWSHKSWKGVIKDAVQNGMLGLLQGYLTITQNDNDFLTNQNLLDVIIKCSKEFVLEVLKQGDLNSGVKMLCNMGLPVNEELLKIFTTTVSRDLRKILLPELKRRKVLSEHSKQIISFLTIVESLHPCMSFEQAKLIHTDKSTYSSLFPTTALFSNLKLSPPVLLVGDVTPCHSTYQTGAYCSLVLDWISNWSQDVQERIFTYHFLCENCQFLLPHISPQVVWQYLLEHGDAACLKKWVKNYLGLLPDFPLEELPFKWPLDGIMVNSVKGNTPAHIEEYILNKLGSNGIFCEEELEDITLFLQRLGHIGYDLSDNQLFLSKTSSISFPDFCHRIIHYCLQFKLFNLFHLFLANTWNSIQPWPTCPICCTPVLNMVIAFCQWSQKPEDSLLVFQAIMMSAVKFYNLPHATLEDLWLNAPLPVFLAAVLYSPLSLEQYFKSSGDNKSINSASLQSVLSPYPLLHDALFHSDHTYKLLPDVTVYQLLQGSSVFDPTRLFGWQEGNIIKNEEAPSEIPHFSLPSLVEQYGLKEELTYLYYLLAGRPHFAYAKFIAKELIEGRLPSTTRIQSVCKEVALLAFNHYQNQKVTSSCVVFTEMLGQDSLHLRVHLVTAKIIIDSLSHNEDFNKDIELTDGDIICLLKHSLDYKEASSQLLQLLEAAISQNQQKLQNRSYIDIAMWFPAVAFSSLNQLEPVVSYLHECTKSGDWLRFLVYSQLYQIPKEQVLKLLPEFPTTCLADHLCNALQVKTKKKEKKPKLKASRNVRDSLYSKIGVPKATASSQDCSPAVSSDDESPVGCSDSISSGSESDAGSLTYARDLFGQILYCDRTDSPWKSLIKVSLHLFNPVLSVIAASYKDAPVLSCFCTWLFTSLNRSKMPKTGQPNFSDNTSCVWTLVDLEKLIETALRSGNITLLRQGVQLFLPDSPLLLLLDYLVSFIIQKDFDSESTTESLKKFQKKIELHEYSEDSCCPLTTHEWVETTSVRILTTAVVMFENSYERFLLLRHLSFARIQNSFSSTVKVTDFNKLYLLMKHVAHIDIPISVEKLLLPEDDPEYGKECWHIVRNFQKLKMYNEANLFAKATKLPLDNVILFQLNQEADGLRNNPELSDTSTNLTFWKEANKTLKCVKPQLAANFFKDQCNIVTSYTEKYFLMKYAVEWLNLVNPQKKDVALLSQWKADLWHLCLKAEEEREVHSADNFSQMIVTIPLDGNHSQKLWSFSSFYNIDDVKSSLSLQVENEVERHVLERLINKLLQTGHLNHAWHLARAFGYESIDLNNIVTCLKLTRMEILPAQIENKGVYDQPKHHCLILNTPGKSESVKSQYHVPVASKISIECLTSEQKEVILLIQQFVEKSDHASTACTRILVYYFVACVLQWSFDSVALEDPFILIKNILVSDNINKYPIAKSLIAVDSLMDKNIAKFLSEEVVKFLQTHIDSSGNVSISQDDTKFLYNPKDESKNFHQLMWLCSDPSILGHRLLNAAKHEIEKYQVSGVKLSLLLTVKLYVFSHDCFTASCHMEGISHILRKARVLANILLEAKEFTLLIHLLTGIGRYSEMTYIFDIFMEHSDIELIYQKAKKEDFHLRLALLDYFKRHPPRNGNCLEMLELTFNSFREIAESLESVAQNKLLSLKRNSGNSAVEELSEVVQNLIAASDSYSKASCIRQAQKCANHAKLVALQVHLLPTQSWVIGLKEEEVHSFIIKHKKFLESFIVAEAYQWHQSWSQALYYNVVDLGDWKYFQEFEACLGLSSHIIEEVAKKFHHSLMKTDNSIINMRRILNLCSNIDVKYKLATNLGFHDMVKDLLKGENKAYLQDLFFAG